jgi:hypothetical protein
MDPQQEKRSVGDAERNMNTEAAIQVPSQQPAFHADDLEQIASYRNLSGLAVVSLLFGLAAPLSFMFPLLLAIPIFGTAVSLVALRRIANSEGVLAGRWAAIVGLALCLASGFATVSYAQVKRWMYVRQAEDLARHWIELVSSEQLDQAFKLTVAGNRPLTPPGPGEPPPTKTPFEEFSQHPLVQQLTSAGENSTVRYAKTLYYEPRPAHQCLVQQRFEITPAATPSTAATTDRRTAFVPVVADLSLQLSQLAGEAQLRWLVAAYQDAAAVPVDQLR